MDKLRADTKRTGKFDKSYRRLNIYICAANRIVPHNHFHVGRSNTSTNDVQSEQPQQSKPLTEEQARRKAERERKEAERHTQRLTEGKA